MRAMSNNYVNPNDPTRRQPYQYPPQKPQSSQNQPPNSSMRPEQQGQYKQNEQRQLYRQPGQQGNYNQPRPQTPMPMAYPNSQQGAPLRPKRRRKGFMIGCLGVLTVLIVFVILITTTVSKALAFGSAISPKAPLS